jgi:hypothetical protein
MDTSQIYTVDPNNQTTVCGLGRQDTITLSSVTAPVYHTDTIDLSMLGAVGSGNLTSPYTVTAGAFPNVAVSGGFTAGTGANVPWMTQSPFAAPKIQLNGEGADVEVNGWSLVAAVKRIEERLGLYQPNPKLEAEWLELKQLGDQYRKLEQQIRDKQATWDRLVAMPPPEID